MLGYVFLLLCVVVLSMYVFKQRQQAKQCQQLYVDVLKEKNRLEQTLKRRNLRLDVITQHINEAVLRLDKSGRVLMMNTKAELTFAKNLTLTLPQPMQVFYRDHEWLHHLGEALARLPDLTLLADVEVNQKIFSARIVSLGQQQALLIFFDVSDERANTLQQTQFLHNLMHDMKTPLTSILAYVRAIHDFGDDLKIRVDSLNAIAAASQRLNHLLDSLLTLESIQQTTGEPTLCSVNAVWQEVKENLNANLEKYALYLTESMEKNAMVNMPAQDLFRIINNVLENVLFHAANGRKVDVYLSQQQPFWVFSVRDYGYGLSDVDMPRVAERFFKAADAREQNQQGHGLGLAIVKDILNKYQGVLVLKHAKPQGLLVELHLRAEYSD